MRDAQGNTCCKGRRGHSADCSSKTVVEAQVLHLQAIPEPAIDSACEVVPERLALPPHNPKPPLTVARIEEIIAAKKAALKAQAESFGPATSPPLDPKDITNETVVAGKSVGEWDADLKSRAEEAKRGTALDCSTLPAWVTWAVEEWNRRGCPTPSIKVLSRITQLREDAEEQVKFSNLDREKAERESNPKKAKKLLEAAQRKSDKAAALFDEADKLAVAHKEGA